MESKVSYKVSLNEGFSYSDRFFDHLSVCDNDFEVLEPDILAQTRFKDSGAG
jgi:hypothetical protein